MIFVYLALLASAALFFWHRHSAAKSRRLLAETHHDFQQALESEAALRHFDVNCLLRKVEQTSRELEFVRENAEGSTDARTALLNNLSRELRSPMNAIVGMNAVLLDTKLTPDQRECLELAHASAEELVALTNDLSDLANMDAGKFTLDPIAFDLEDAILYAVRLLMPAAQKKGVKLSCKFHPALPDTVFGDVARLRQLLSNLLVKALEFAAPGEIVVHLFADERGSDRACLHFSIAGNALALPDAAKKQISTAFQELYPAQDFAAAGFALAISARALELFGGRFWMEPAGGNCTSLHFSANLELIESDFLSTPKQVDLRGVSVLIVDGNPVARKNLQDTLTAWGLSITAVETGEQAIAAYQDAVVSGHPFAVIVADRTLPDVDAFEFCERVQQLTPPQPARTILLTAGGRRGDGARSRQAGVAAYLSQPCDQAELLACVQAVVARYSEPLDSLVTRHSLRESRARLSQSQPKTAG